MKKATLLVLAAMFSIAVKAQTINTDTLAKYSKKEEQLKIFNFIASDIHLNSSQREQYDKVSTVYASQALVVIGNKTTGRREKIQALRKIGEEYMTKLKAFMTSAQIEALKEEREKYHFGKRFLVSQ